MPLLLRTARAALLGTTALSLAAHAAGAQSRKPSDELDTRIAQVMSKVVTWRRDFHEHPELSNSEKRTAKIVAEHLQKFAEHAWRRPVKKEELEEYMKAFRSEREAGEKMADAYREALMGVLTSRHFIYLVEGDPAPRERLNDSELAARLSYFMWSSMPDEGLYAAARTGSLDGDALGDYGDQRLELRRLDLGASRACGATAEQLVAA